VGALISINFGALEQTQLRIFDFGLQIEIPNISRIQNPKSKINITLDDFFLDKCIRKINIHKF